MNAIYNLKLHETTTFDADGRHSYDGYIVMRVHGGWIYTDLTRNISVYVPYTIHTDGQLDNEGQAGNREIPEASGKSTHEVAESDFLAKSREIVDQLTEEEKEELLRELNRRNE